MECPDGFLCLQLKDVATILVLIATIVAIFYGPIRAVQITKTNEEKREKRKRQYSVFHTLMKTRRMSLAGEHVMALNLVQIEFYGQERIVAAYKRYMEHLSLPVPTPATEDAYFEERWDRFFELIHEIGLSLGYTLDKRELAKFAYVPVGWNNDEMEMRLFRQKVIQLLSGRAGIPVYEFKVTDFLGKFPPPPPIDSEPVNTVAGLGGDQKKP